MLISAWFQKDRVESRTASGTAAGQPSQHPTTVIGAAIDKRSCESLNVNHASLRCT